MVARLSHRDSFVEAWNSEVRLGPEQDNRIDRRLAEIAEWQRQRDKLLRALKSETSRQFSQRWYAGCDLRSLAPHAIDPKLQPVRRFPLKQTDESSRD